MRFGPRGQNGMQSTEPPLRTVEQVKQHVGRLILSMRPVSVTDGVWVTGEIPRRHRFEDGNGYFFLNEARTQHDPLVDDQALCVETGRGLVVLLGCAHAGVVNTLDYVAELRPEQPIHAVVGGMHLHGADAQRIEETVAALRRHEVQLIAPGHCTGFAATRALFAALDSRCVDLFTGSRFVFA
jgi:7,8-dihydropterin-6-yl-methyl-4-(beta-D-ribofuranosyl)aminobenzene 5'-phosphate synthase